MQHFESDYLEGAHPAVLARLAETNLEKTEGYGTDKYCASAREKIKLACDCPQAEVHFLVGGTQTNATVIRALLRPYEGVIAANSGHISVHEAGAIEAGGHKVLTLPHQDGKLMPQTVAQYLETFYRDGNHEHMVFPGMVYISHPTEYGTLYTKEELTELHALCRMYDIPLYLDGARLAYALASKQTDVTLADIAKLCDIFYIGGTKCGALFGEAVVIPTPQRIPHFFTIIKQQGALLAKGRLLGVQFEALFQDGLYEKIGAHAIEMAELLKEGLHRKGYTFYLKSPTNQQFLTLENSRLEKLSEQVCYSFWESADENHTIIRLATSWATRKEDVEALLACL